MARNFTTALKDLLWPAVCELRKWRPPPGWTSRRPPRVAMTLLCKDEADIIRQHITYHLPKVDFLIVTDNGSTDGTREMLAAFESERVIVLDDPRPFNIQFKAVDQMIRMARDRGADWLVNSDADEFWVGDFQAVADRYRRRWYSSLWAPSFRMRPCCAEKAAEADPIARMRWRERVSDKGFRKVFHETARYQKIDQGNHNVHIRGGRKAEVLPGEMRIYHYQWRGFEHYLRKCVSISKAYEKSGMREIYGQHLKRVYNVWKAQGEQGVRELYQREVYVPESGMGELVRDDTVAATLGQTNPP